jgi:CubicO group peptidase (beta-lactamase class C family)
VARLAKSYKPNADKNDLEETKIGQLRYPLADRTRGPMPAGGLFSTAHDLARFCQVVANGGELEGKRYLSEASVSEMTKRQTGEGIRESYGLGWATPGTSFGHGGAYATNMSIDRKTGLITIFLVQHAGFPGEGAQSRSAFEKAAHAEFGSQSR